MYQLSMVKGSDDEALMKRATLDAEEEARGQAEKKRCVALADEQSTSMATMEARVCEATRAAAEEATAAATAAAAEAAVLATRQRRLALQRQARRRALFLIFFSRRSSVSRAVVCVTHGGQKVVNS